MAEVAPYAFRAPLTACIDFKNPHAYLGKDPTYALADEFGIDVEWLPLCVEPLSQPLPINARDDRGTRHRKMRSAYFERDLARYAEVRGVTLRGVYRAPDSALAGGGLLWVQRSEPRATRAYIDAVFEGYFAERLDLEDAGALTAVLDRVGVPSTGFADHWADVGRAEHAALQAGLRAAGLFSVPGYAIEDSIFLGREHLPMIRWMLSGRRGPGPI